MEELCESEDKEDQMTPVIWLAAPGHNTAQLERLGIAKTK